MRQSTYSRTLGLVLAVGAFAGVLGILGCGNEPQRASSEALRKATKSARTTLNEAQALLSNPTIGNDAKARAEALNKADSLLGQADHALDEALRQAGGEGAEPLSQDVGEARLTLGLIQATRGECNVIRLRNQANLIAADIRAGQLVLNRLRMAAVALAAQQAALAHNDDDVTKGQAQAKKDLAAATAKVTEYTEAIAANDKAVTAAEQAVQTAIVRGGTLRTEAELARGQESLQKLYAAIASERKAHAEQQKVDDLLAKKVELQSALTEWQVRKARAEGALASAASVSKGRKEQDAKANTRRDETLARVREDAKTLQEHLTTIGKAVVQANEWVSTASRQFDAAVRTAGQSNTLVREGMQAEALAEQADLEAGAGDLQRVVAQIRSLLEGVTGDVTEVWDQLPSGKPAQPTSPQIAEFIREHEKSADMAIQAYRVAVEKQRSASDRAPRESRWQFQWSLATRQLAYAAALSAGGQSDADAVQAARDLLPDIERGAAAAGKSGELAGLKRLLSAN